MHRRTRAGLYVPEGLDICRWLQAQHAFADERGWQVTGVYRRWQDLVERMLAGEVQIGVVGTRRHLPPDREPRIEVVDEQEPPTLPAPRRPRRLTTSEEPPPPDA